MVSRILVTGGAGYIGSHTCKALAAAGYAPVVLDDLSTGHRWAVKWGPLITADIADRTQVWKALEAFGIEAVIHFAAHAHVGESVEQPRKYFDNNVSRTLALLDTLVDAAAQGVTAPIEIFGTDYDTEDGTAVRDYIHVCDLADAHVRAVDHLLAGGASISVNLGTGRGYSVRDVITAVEAVGGSPVLLRHGLRRAGDPAALIADPQLAQSVLQWTPQMSDIRTIVRTAWDWYGKQFAPRASEDEESVKSELV